MKWLLVLACVLPCSSWAGSIYLCRAYSGGTFWAKSYCGQHNAHVERIVSVPDTMSWEEQVRLAEQDRAQRAAAAAAQSTSTSTVVEMQPTKEAECAALSARAARLDAMARQPQPGRTQDWITGEKRSVTDQQYRLRC